MSVPEEVGDLVFCRYYLDERSKNIRPWESRQEFLFQHLPEPHDRIWHRSRMSSNSTASLPRGEPLRSLRV